MNIDNKFFYVMGKVTDAMILSILFVISCVPLVTIGASLTALYYTMHKVIRHDRGYLWQQYKHAWKENFWQATICWVIFLALAILLGFDLRLTYRMFLAGEALGKIYYFFVVLLVLEAIWAAYTFAYIARFQNKTKIILKNCAMIMIYHFPASLAVLLTLGLSAFALYLVPALIIVIPALVAWLLEFFLERVFRNYMDPSDLEQEEMDRND